MQQTRLPDDKSRFHWLLRLVHTALAYTIWVTRLDIGQYDRICCIRREEFSMATEEDKENEEGFDEFLGL